MHYCTSMCLRLDFNQVTNQSNYQELHEIYRENLLKESVRRSYKNIDNPVKNIRWSSTYPNTVNCSSEDMYPSDQNQSHVGKLKLESSCKGSRGYPRPHRARHKCLALGDLL